MSTGDDMEETHGKPDSGPSEIDLAHITGLLDNRFGDGLVYLEESGDRLTPAVAVALGLVDPEGFVTSAGLRFPERWRERLIEPVIRPVSGIPGARPWRHPSPLP